jgi:hypothetical protein
VGPTAGIPSGLEAHRRQQSAARSRVRSHPNRCSARSTRASFSRATCRPSLRMMIVMLCIAQRPFTPQCDWGRIGGTNSRTAAEAHRTLPPAVRRAGCLPGLDARSCALEMQAHPPLTCPASGALHGQETCSTAAAGRGRASVCALPDLTRFPARAGRVRGVSPPELNRHAGARLPRRRRANALPVASSRLPPATC